MTPAEALLHDILGPTRCDVRPLALAIEYTIESLYHKGRETDMHASKEIYPHVASELKKDQRAVAKAIERLTAQCLNALSPEAQEKILGEVLQFRPSPREMLFYLTYYVYRGRPYRTDNERNPFEPTIAF